MKVILTWNVKKEARQIFPGLNCTIMVRLQRRPMLAYFKQRQHIKQKHQQIYMGVKSPVANTVKSINVN